MRVDGAGQKEIISIPMLMQQKKKMIHGERKTPRNGSKYNFRLFRGSMKFADFFKLTTQCSDSPWHSSEDS